MNRRQPLNNYSMLSVGCICWMLAFMSSRLQHVIFYLLAIGGVGLAIFAASALWSASAKKSALIMPANQQYERASARIQMAALRNE